MTTPAPLRCAAHPDVETNLRCGKCDKPICPKCLVETPVGARCQECARLYKLPTYRVSGQYYLRAAGTSLGLAVAIGVIWGLIANYLPSYIFSLIVAYGIGWVIGELISRAVNRKRGLWLAVIGGGGAALCYAAIYLTDYYIQGYFDLNLYRSVFNLVSLGITVYLAVNRLR